MTLLTRGEMGGRERNIGTHGMAQARAQIEAG
eukprot:CAMPEP_0171105592 /NCGR_PEP_ID=MMETSP0766_2-20121228/63035_1 /TAXON_ID=439317 /ORGANISM="Gambierdiscus australes, Strain CAWD 149" /LENGTH=31 /DNA_ID= /DNA_START= /DNA_END= /DNA_ORIENTATION=